MYRRIVCPWQIMGIIDPTFLRVIDKHFFFLRFLDNHSFEIKIRETRIPEHINYRLLPASNTNGT